MMKYSCPKVLCALYESCPCDHMIPAQEQSAPDDDTGEPLYFAACSELGETFCNLRADKLVDDALPRNGEDSAASVPKSIGRLYGQLAFVNLSNDDSKLRMGLSALSECVRDCIFRREVRMFGCPLFMRTVYEINQTKVASIRLAESEEAEGLWTDFKKKLGLALTVLSKNGLSGVDRMKNWLRDCGEITGKAGGFRGYRRIRHETLDGLLDQCRDIAILNHADYDEAIQLVYGGIFDDIDAMPAFLPLSQTARTAAAIETERNYRKPVKPEVKSTEDDVNADDIATIKAQNAEILSVVRANSGKLDEQHEMEETELVRLNSLHRRFDEHKEKGKYGKNRGEEENRKAAEIWEQAQKEIVPKHNKLSCEEVYDIPRWRSRINKLGIESAEDFRRAFQTYYKTEKNRAQRIDGKNRRQGES